MAKYITATAFPHTGPFVLDWHDWTYAWKTFFSAIAKGYSVTVYSLATGSYVTWTPDGGFMGINLQN